MRNTEIIERPTDQTTITRRYTEHAVDFVTRHREQPFFLYLAHSMPHVPLFRSPEFEGRSARGLYGDVIEELDWSVGQILSTLKKLALDEQTLVFFCSDNGPWLVFNEQGGSAGLLRDGKGSTWEGGMREPAIAWWPGHISAGVVSQDLGSTMDIFATALALAKVELPVDTVLDGVDLSPVLLGTGSGPRDSIFYYRGTRLMAVRQGPWKAHFITQNAYGGPKATPHDPPLLYHLEHDPCERFDVAAEHPDVLARIQQLVVSHRENLTIPPSQLEVPMPKIGD